MLAGAYIFCSALQSAQAEGKHIANVTFLLLQETRPITADWPALVDTNGSWIYFVAQVQYATSFSHCRPPPQPPIPSLKAIYNPPPSFPIIMPLAYDATLVPLP